MLRHVTDEEIEQRVKVLRAELDLQNQSRPDLITAIEKLTPAFGTSATSRFPTPKCPVPRRNGTPEKASYASVRVSSLPCRGVSQEPG